MDNAKNSLAETVFVICGLALLGVVSNFILWIKFETYMIHPLLAAVFVPSFLILMVLAGMKIRQDKKGGEQSATAQIRCDSDGYRAKHDRL